LPTKDIHGTVGDVGWASQGRFISFCSGVIIVIIVDLWNYYFTYFSLQWVDPFRPRRDFLSSIAF
jgi:hypothetical protein